MLSWDFRRCFITVFDQTKEERDEQKEIIRLENLEAEQRRKEKEYDQVLLKTYLIVIPILTNIS